MTLDFTLLNDQGLFASLAPLVSVSDRLGIPGTGDHARVLHTRVAGGFDMDVLPGRGFDIGDTMIGGLPLSWISPIHDRRPLDAPVGDTWLQRFNGGLLTTCGFGNIGPATATEGLHGRAAHLPATDIHTTTTNEPVGPTARLTATVDSIQLFGPSYRLTRSIESCAGPAAPARLRIVDEVENVGVEPAPLSLLYHLNFGAPLIVPGTVVDVPAAHIARREGNPSVPDPRVLPAPCSHITEAVFEHRAPVIDATGFAHATISSPSGMRLDLAWTAATLPYIYQWVLPTARHWALAIEPATAPLFGTNRQRPYAGAPLLAPEDRRRHELILTFGGGG